MKELKSQSSGSARAHWQLTRDAQLIDDTYMFGPPDALHDMKIALSTGGFSEDSHKTISDKINAWAEEDKKNPKAFITGVALNLSARDFNLNDAFHFVERNAPAIFEQYGLVISFAKHKHEGVRGGHNESEAQQIERMKTYRDLKEDILLVCVPVDMRDPEKKMTDYSREKAHDLLSHFLAQGVITDEMVADSPVAERYSLIKAQADKLRS